MREAGKPVAAGEVATLSGLERKIVDKVFAELKKRRSDCLTCKMQVDTCAVGYGPSEQHRDSNSGVAVFCYVFYNNFFTFED